jgi:hypothetical protein
MQQTTCEAGTICATCLCLFGVIWENGENETRPSYTEKCDSYELSLQAEYTGKEEKVV